MTGPRPPAASGRRREAADGRSAGGKDRIRRGGGEAADAGLVPDPAGRRSNVPKDGPVILASNHRSNMDPVLLASALQRPVAFMAKAELFVGPLGWIMRWIGQFPVRRGGIDREALRRTDAVLARGSMLGLFPEGTRGEGRFAAVHPGLAYIVVRQRCPVLPVASSAPSGSGAGSAGCRSRPRSGSSSARRSTCPSRPATGPAAAPARSSASASRPSWPRRAATPPGPDDTSSQSR